MLLLAALWTLLIWSPDAAQQASEHSDAPIEPGPIVTVAPTDAPPAALAPAPAAKPVAPHAAQAPAEDDEPLEPTEPVPAQPPTPRFTLPKLPPPQATGPIAALKVRFGNESPSATSKQVEQQLTAALQRTGPPPHSLEDVVCRRTVCRISWRWKAEHVIPYGQALGALRSFDAHPGIEGAGAADADNSRPVAIYVDLTASK